MKFIPFTICAALAGAMSLAQATDTDAVAPQQIEIPRHRVGDFVVQGAITPAWLLPGPASAPAAAAQARAQPSGAVAPPPSAAPAQPARMGNRQWRERIAALEAEVEARKGELGQARESLVTAIAEEARQAQEQYAAAQRHAEEMRRQAERAAAAATAARPGQAPANLPAAAPPELVFALRKADRTMAAALGRWGEEAGYHVLWEDREDPPVPFEDTYAVPLPDAVHRVVSALNMAGMRLLMCQYSNRVVRVVPLDAGCRVQRNIQSNLADGVAR